MSKNIPTKSFWVPKQKILFIVTIGGEIRDLFGAEWERGKLWWRLCPRPCLFCIVIITSLCHHWRRGGGRQSQSNNKCHQMSPSASAHQSWMIIPNKSGQFSLDISDNFLIFYVTLETILEKSETKVIIFCSPDPRLLFST